MIQYEQATIDLLLSPAEPFGRQVTVAPTPIRGRVVRTDVPAEGAAHFNVYVYLVSIDPSRNRCRFYTLTWQPSLFEGGAIVRRWGRIGTEGRWRAIFFGSREEAQGMVEGILKRRLDHGCEVVRWE
jgi:predicted DNA-binding WGR domain protein